MPAVFIPRGGRVAANGSALVIVLFFIILLSVVTIAFLARSLTAVKVSASSAGETKSKILAVSASDIIIGDFKQEIIAGSAANSGAANYPLYFPSYNTNMIPFQNGVPTSGTLIPNLISRSVNPNNTSGAAPSKSYPASYAAALVPLNRAANDSSSMTSTSLPSVNGRYVSAAQWNSHYLIPRDPSHVTPGSISTDSTPVSSFVVPDWVVVTRSGANSVSWTGGAGGLNDPTISNNNCAVGRYAFAVYNEGGTLDMNVAGFPADPSNPGASGSNGLTTAQSSQKGSLALADLTQLTAGGVNLTQTQINNFVGWRNYASSKFSAANGTYGSFTFTPATASNWLTNFVSANTNGFMQIVPPPAGQLTPPTDQAILSRQQLISVTQSLGISPDFLQYMGTFSRGLEQPSFVPDPNRPRTINSTTVPPGNSGVVNYLGNNDAASGTATPKDDSWNPSFLTIRVQSAFKRWNGQTALVGEPLVIRKFALSQLSYFNYASTTATVQTAHAVSGVDADPMLDRFGLTRTSATAPWTYFHGQNYIMTLAQVSAANREPDMAELLKAAICVGSLAKGAPNLASTYYNYNYFGDVTTDYDVLQIMANLIDQYDTDSYPTRIQIALPGGSNTGGPFHILCGVEDLPYIYRWHAMTVCDTLPTPATAMIKQAENGTKAAPSGFNGGDVKEMYFVDLWNPHDASTLVNSANLRPTKYRLYALWQDPDAQTTVWTTPSLYIPYPTGYPTTALHSSSFSLTQANSAMIISDTTGGMAFREPTMIWRQNYPSGVTVSAPNGTITDAANTGSPAGSQTVTYCGIVVGSMPAEVVDTSNNLWQALNAGVDMNFGRGTGTYSQINFVLQYEYPAGSGSYITYDNFYSDIHGLQSYPRVVVNAADTASYPNGCIQSPFKSGQVTQWGGGTVMDPRTGRFAPATGAFLGQAGHNANGPNNGDFLLEPTAYANFSGGNQNSGSATINAAIGNTYTILETDRPRADAGDIADYSNPCQVFDPPPAGPGPLPQMRFYSGQEYRSGSGTTNPSGEYNGLFSQNTPAISSAALSQSGSYSAAQLYYEDPDGVNRRAMGAYAVTNPAGLSGAGAVDSAAADELGLPLATANNYADGGSLSPSSVLPQTQSRPYILNRPFHSVSDMSYTFRNSPWKNINFFTPESGDSALLDTFCVNEPPPSALVAGKVDLNTRQVPVLAAVISGASRDEAYNYASTTPTATTLTYALKPVTGVEANNVAKALVNYTTATDPWRGPLVNISGLVGRYANVGNAAVSAPDAYSFQDPSTGTWYCYSGLSAMLGGGASGPGQNIYTDTSTVPSGVQAAAPYTIQRFTEAGLRPLIDAGQVRVWNLLIDVVAQTGRYPKSATGFDQFVVDGQTRLWVHVAIDRYTGQVIDKQVEVCTP